MFSFLDMINHYLGYVNLNVKLKNRIYTILGVLGVIYLLYVSVRWIKNGFGLRGSLILLVAIILAYFSVMNVFYYFTKKKAPLDISPKIEKVLGKTLGGNVEEAEETKQSGRERRGNDLLNGANIPANGYFDSKKILPGKVAVNSEQSANISQLANQLQQMNLMTPNYGGLGSRELAQQITQNKKPVYAIGLGVNIPYFELQQDGQQMIVYAGMNQAQKQPMGKITTVGLQPIADVYDKVKLYLANVILVGGPYMVMGRNEPIEKQAPYTIRVQLAYEREARAHAEQPGERTAAQPSTARPTLTTREPASRMKRYH
ncbi:DUF6681 family protein [Secundilactobacillus silagei]|uniref:Uncharacterized protein n=1 Tax=Secundilactobacillus silagei JCM 19001 TaxID=1302250 RepID=A0A1Z5H3P5_9LACO|nr:DUF6681 family protein [Secundilactobacillus silagei]TDG70321.1 hypothetical protein C5L25_001511 [Secundilactobacillus silagei JCM 19001]GAT17907.1 hypothetical protein IWT126_00164 [Secundilactobacillus silagei JCM 19001]